MKYISFSQGTSYSCQTLASIGAIACNPVGLKKLNEICKPVSNGFEITFCKYPDIKLIVSQEELTEWSEEELKESECDFKQRLERIKEVLLPHWKIPRPRPEHVSGDPLVRMLELAYAKLMLALEPSKYPELTNGQSKSNPLRLYHHKKFHYDPGRSISDITNWSVMQLIANGGTQFELSKSFMGESEKDTIAIDKARAELAKISDNPEKYIAVVSSVGASGDCVFLDPGSKIFPYHDYVAKKIDDKEQTICLLDPYGSRIRLELDYDDFFQYFNGITTATVV